MNVDQVFTKSRGHFRHIWEIDSLKISVEV